MRDPLSERKLAGGDRMAINSQPILDSGLRRTSVMMNTRGGMCGGLAYVMVILLFLVASPVVQCRLHGLASAGTAAGSLRNTTNNGAHLGVDEKVALIFCVPGVCDEDGASCYCCETLKPEPLCWHTLNECKANCPTCNPKCRP
ncbi:hypothetical protein PVAP13_1NG400200 [Panicum virgatum]|uniref:Uncharacterized protein n=1 Tax=Panicum virgatum TaxID=38727 RepID=A0A8T0X2K4_PANVG|nr:hypothetical protein PVAP13_1NG400200 [Panicum virgatum]